MNKMKANIELNEFETLANQLERITADLKELQNAGYSIVMLCQIERGTKNLSLQIASEMALALGCAIEDFLNDVA